jgi:hypothetical protein
VALTRVTIARPNPLLRRRLQRLELRLVVCRPEMLDLARPCCEDHTIWTAVSPDVVVTVRMYGKATLRGAPSAQIQLQ